MMAKLEMPNVCGRTVDSIILYDDPLSGRELTIRFKDDTELSVMVGCRQVVTVRHFEVGKDNTLFTRDEAKL